MSPFWVVDSVTSSRTIVSTPNHTISRPLLSHSHNYLPPSFLFLFLLYLISSSFTLPFFYSVSSFPFCPFSWLPTFTSLPELADPKQGCFTPNAVRSDHWKRQTKAPDIGCWDSLGTIFPVADLHRVSVGVIYSVLLVGTKEYNPCLTDSIHPSGTFCSLNPTCVGWHFSESSE